MDDTEESVDSSVTQEPFFNPPKGDRSSTHNFTASQSSGQDDNCAATQISESIMDSERTEIKHSSNTSVNSAGDSKQVCPAVPDHSVPCDDQSPMSISVSSPIAALVPTTNKSIPTQQLQEQSILSETGSTANEEVTNLDGSSSVGYQVINYVSGDDISNNNYSFTVSQEEGYNALTDEDSCDASYLQSVRDSANAFNQQYRDKRDVEESSTAAGPFSPEAFFSSIPLFRKLRKRPAAILPKLTDASTNYCQSDQLYSIGSHAVPSFALVMQDSNQGVPIAPKPNPNAKVSCYVLVVPAPLYYDNFTAQENLQLQQDHHEDISETDPPEPHPAITEIETTPEATQLSNLGPMYPPEWTPQPQMPARTPLPSTLMRVSPSPNRGSKSSPIITVSTTSTPIQPLQGNKQQYVIVQGNHRHLQGTASYKDSFTTPTLQENHQPIYLQGLPPQGFRRLWKTKEGSCTERTTTKRSLAPLFSKISQSVSQEATVPQMEKSPLTCIRSKLPCDREVPETDSMSPVRNLLTNEKSSDSLTPTPAVEETGSQTTTSTDGTVQECQNKNELELPLHSENNETDENTVTPTSKGRHGEDKERKKTRDRRYDAELKKAFHELRQVVPRLQMSSSRGKILQETIKYIGILEKKVLDAGLWSTLQSIEAAQRIAQLEGAAEEIPGEKTQGVTDLSCDVPDVCGSLVSNTVEEPLTMASEEEGVENSQETTTTALTSPIILIPSASLSTDELSCSFVSHEGAVVSIDSVDTNVEGVTVEELPLPIQFQQIQFLAVDQSDENPVLSPHSPNGPQSEEPHTRLIPVVEVPGYTESSEYLGVTQGGLSDLGVALSPLLSPLGILLSPGGDRNQESTITVVLESKEGANAEENVHVMSGICTDMTSIAASVEVTTDQRDNRTSLSTSKTRRSSKSRPAQIVPSLSPLQAGEDDSTRNTPRCRNRRVLQDHSNFEDARSPVIGEGRGRRRRLKDHPPKQRLHGDADENSAFAANQSRTPPGRVSGVLLGGKRKTPSPHRGVGTKRVRRI
ncbi:hypothetical protein OS493_034556 [Desmophyllum pertusum]|uniref:BHLH domain-containing protein n=1 Tax=Desmophyllum pertusum TaxID=174260 RepID=A0A9X0CDZ4_9CNID|nr:hypothetical protein OS493_034556 [Desmophyllum pertusum]